MQLLAAMEKLMLASPDQQISLTDPDSRSMATSGRGSGALLRAGVSEGLAEARRDLVLEVGVVQRAVLAQVAAERLGLPADQVRVELGRSDLPASWGSGGSWGASSSELSRYRPRASPYASVKAQICDADHRRARRDLLYRRQPTHTREHVMTWTSDRAGVVFYTVLGMLIVLSSIYIPA
jgi:hypothetical protein